MIKIIPASPEHISFIADCQAAMAKETENYDLPLDVLQKGVSHIFQKPEKGFYLIAEADSELVACMLVLYEWSDWRNGEVLWIHSLFVKKEFRRRKIFSQFYDFLQKKVLENEHFRGIRLYAEKNNEIAHAAYRKVGMSNEHYEMFEWLKA